MSSPNRTKDSAAAAVAVILPKLQELRRLADAARWGLLDVIVWADEIEDDLTGSSKRALHAALDDLDCTGLTANRLDSEAREYQPDDDRGWCS